MATNYEIRFYAKKHNISKEAAKAELNSHNFVQPNTSHININMSKIVIRYADKYDIESTYPLYATARLEYRNNGGTITGGFVNHSIRKAAFASQIEDKQIAVAVFGGAIVGFVENNQSIKWIAGDNKNVIDWCFTHPSFRKNGIATALYKFAFEQMNCAFICLEWQRVLSKIDYWRSIGFTLVLPKLKQNASLKAITFLYNGVPPLSGICFELLEVNVKRHLLVNQTTCGNFNPYAPLSLPLKNKVKLAA